MRPVPARCEYREQKSTRYPRCESAPTRALWQPPILESLRVSLGIKEAIPVVFYCQEHADATPAQGWTSLDAYVVFATERCLEGKKV